MRVNLQRSAFVLTAVCFGGLAGCASVDDGGVLLSEQPTFQAGYGDGCATGIEEDKSFSREKTRDSYLFDNDRAYRAGWRQGYLSCTERNRDNPSDGGILLGQDNQYR